MLSIFAMMKSKNAISKLLLITALLFTVVFQFAHSLSHFSAEIEPISLHKAVKTSVKSDQHTHDVSADEHSSEKCFACDFFLSPFLQAESLAFHVLEMSRAHLVKELVIVPFYQFTSIYYSLRAPPLLF